MINVNVSSNSAESPRRCGRLCYDRKGFSIEEFEKSVSPDEPYKKYLTACLHDDKKQQIAFIDDIALEEKLEDDNVPDGISPKIKHYFTKTTMLPNDVKEYLKNRGAFMQTLFDIWDNSSLHALKLTSVGIALAQANFRRKTGITIDLGVWIK